MKFVALVSGGKDSLYSVLLAKRRGHQLAACVHLAAPAAAAAAAAGTAGEEEESFMYQTAASEAVRCQVEECLEVPLISYRRTGRSVDTGLVYGGDGDEDGDEVEDLHRALLVARERFPDVTAVCSGAILSTYQRIRVERVACDRLGWTSLSYLWRLAGQETLLRDVLAAGLTAVTVRTASPPGLRPAEHLNRPLGQLLPHLLTLREKYRFHVAGEGGEYETLVLDCPALFPRNRLVLDEVEVVLDGEDDGVGVLRIKSCHAEPRDGRGIITPGQARSGEGTSVAETEESDAAVVVAKKLETPKTSSVKQTIVELPPPPPHFLPHVRHAKGGLVHVSELMSPIRAACETEAEAAVEEAARVLDLLGRILQRCGGSPADAVMVHLYLSEISHFARINDKYRHFFGVLLPPSRSCVAVGRDVLPGGRRVLLDCLFLVGSGQYMRLSGSPRAARVENPYAKAALANSTSKLREVLHVQSISSWAPVCVGPYSQVNTVRSCLHFCAGQIGLEPATMELRPTWTEQLEQSWTNVARVLDALDNGSLEHVVQCLVYVADSVYHEIDAEQIQSICRTQMECNGGVVPGAVDDVPTADNLNGYEDEETTRELEKKNSSDEKPDLCPVLVLSIPEMPVGASAEVEVVAATRKAATCLGMMQRLRHGVWENLDAQQEESWDTGHDFCVDSSTACPVQMNVSFRSIGANGAACFALVTAALESRGDSPCDTLSVLTGMLRALCENPPFDVSNVLQVRLYHVAALFDPSSASVIPQDDGTQLRSAFSAAVTSVFPDAKPATTVVPVRGMRVLNQYMIGCAPMFAVQAMALDPVKLETSLWIQHGR
jgi:diphthine-ammonia ligase